MLAFAVSLPLAAGFGFLGRMGLVGCLVLGFVVGSAALLGSRQHRDVSIQAIAVLAAVAGVALSALLAASQSHRDNLPRALILAQYGRAYVEPALAAIIGALIRFRVW